MSRLDIRARVYHAMQGDTSLKCLVNAELVGLMHINSIKVQTSNKRPDLLNVYPPSYRNKNTNEFKPFIEFPNLQHNRFLEALNKACTSAYKVYEDKKKYQHCGDTFSVELDDLITNQSLAETTGDIAPDDIPDDFDIGKELDRVNL